MFSIQEGKGNEAMRRWGSGGLRAWTADMVVKMMVIRSLGIIVSMKGVLLGR